MGLLKAKLAKYRSQLLEPSGKKGEKGEGFDVMKSGDARVALIGFPSVGKVICSSSPNLNVFLVNYAIDFIWFSTSSVHSSEYGDRNEK